MAIKSTLLVLVLLFTGTLCHSSNDEKDIVDTSNRKILVDKYEDRKTGCKITYEYYKTEDGKKVMHGKYKRQWSVPKSDRNVWSGKETVTATFVNNKLNGTVVINCDKQKWKRKNEFVKGKGRQVRLIPVESYVARNLKLDVKNDTLIGNINFQLGNFKYEVQGKINDQNEVVGKYSVYKKVDDASVANLSRGNSGKWEVFEQYLCDPEYTYKDAMPKISEVDLGYNGTTRAEQIRIKIPRLRLSINPL